MSEFKPAIGSDAIQDLVTAALLQTPPETPHPLPADNTWIRKAFVLPSTGDDRQREDRLQRMDRQDYPLAAFNGAQLKFTNASLGGNMCINPPAQFTPYADVYSQGIRANGADTSIHASTADIGMGQYYSQAIDDNSQIVHIQLGVPQYNSIIQFFAGFYSSEAGTAARQGRFSDSYIQKFLNFTGEVIGMVIAPLVLVPVAILMLGQAARYFMGYPASSFMNLRPTMEMYWNAVTQLVNQMGANQGIIQYMEPDSTNEVIGDVKTPQADLMSKFFPDMFNRQGTLDVFAVANRAKRLQMAHEILFVDRLEKSGGNYFEAVRETYGSVGSPKVVTEFGTKTTIEAFLLRFVQFDKYSRVSDEGAKKGKVEEDPRLIDKKEEDQTIIDPDASYSKPGIFSEFVEHALANTGDGADWVSFRVNYTGTVSETFSNQTAPSALAQKLNAISAQARDVTNALSGTMIGEAASAVKTVLGGIAGTVQLEGLFAAAGAAFVDIQDHWDSSQASINKSSYSMTLTSPYGNPLSQFFNIYVPLAMIMACALPLSTGKQSHTSPFLLRLHDRGRCITRLGIMDSLTISRGVGNMGFDNEGRAMSIKVDFTIKDLSNIVAMPIQPVFRLNPADALFDTENSFTDYLMALSHVDLRDAMYRVPLLKMNLNRYMASLDQFFSTTHFASWLANAPGSALIRGVMSGAFRE